MYQASIEANEASESCGQRWVLSVGVSSQLSKAFPISSPAQFPLTTTHKTTHSAFNKSSLLFSRPHPRSTAHSVQYDKQQQYGLQRHTVRLELFQEVMGTTQADHPRPRGCSGEFHSSVHTAAVSLWRVQPVHATPSTAYDELIASM
jgi:hypothetical protein